MSFLKGARLSELPRGTARAVRIGDEKILIVRTDKGDVYAVENRCSHDGGDFEHSSLKGNILTCPRHGATFDVSDGKALTMPAVAPIQTYSVRINDDDVEIDVEDDE
jgi:3-phenylpropionate/trans-cinnamate dioxygenase ferredoxin subunit